MDNKSNQIVVAKLVRLGKNGDRFDPKIPVETERTNAKVSQATVDSINANTQYSGRMYIVDEKATAERDKKLSGKSEPKEKDEKATAETKSKPGPKPSNNQKS